MAGPTAGDANGHLDDATLLSQLHNLVERDRRTTARLLWHLGEVDARGLYRDEGYSALFEYCVKALHMSEAEAALRIRAARLSRQFPAVLCLVERGELHLSALRVLSPVLTQDNHARLLRAATHRTKRQVEELVADLCPQPDAPNGIRELPSPRSNARSRTTGPTPSPTLDLLSVAARQGPGQSAKGPEAPAPKRPLDSEHQHTQPAARSAPAPTTTPLGQQRYRVQFTADKQLYDQLLQAKELLRLQVPDGDLATIVGQAMTLLIEQTKKRRFGQTERPRTSKKKDRQAQLDPRQDSRHIPHDVRRKVLERDGMRCTFLSDSGHRCETTGMLEFHHEDPHARGGPPTADNIRLLCRAHNALLAERDFGRGFILQARRGRSTNQVRDQTIPGPSPS